MPRRLELRQGSPAPLGATWDGDGTNFAIYSEGATAIQLALVDDAGVETRVPVAQRSEHVWHVHVAGVGPGQRYAYYIDGPWQPQAGLRFNPATRLLDPYARAVDGVERWEEGAFAYDLDHPDRDLVRNDRPQRAAPLAVVIDPRFDWDDDAPPRVPIADAVIYEAHVKGLTWRHPHVDPAARGTYGGVASDAMVRYLRDLGVTSIELLPVHHFVDDKLLLDRGLRNYWGYNTIGFFAPDPRYRAGQGVGDEVRQFKQMVKALHRAGLEVILDVVYNHTAEGNHLGPTFSLKGVDNPTYYRLVGDSPRHYFDYTGTGNSLNVRHPQTLRLIMDSLRYWVEEMHVDGFRFDLASTLARSLHEVDPLSSFFVIINQDPVIGRVKLIAEPWDVGEGGYQVGGFPVGWSEWNGRYRDTVRGFWRGDGGLVPELGYRLTGSSDLYQNDGRHPGSSVNLVTAHDGFTLRDLVSYDHKHNEANGEDNRDGSDHERSWNCGAEGPTDDPAIERLRARQVRNFVATLLLSQGTPMICAGDELGRTQRGNNNAYCQDSDVSWLDWELGDDQRALLDFTRRVLRLRAEHPTFRRATFFRGRPIRGLDVADLIWLRPDGERMGDDDWQDPAARCLGMYLAGAGVDRVDDATGAPLADDDFLLVVNAGDDVDVRLPAIHERGAAQPWELVIDTADDDARDARRPGAVVRMVARSLRLYTRPSPSRSGARSIGGAPTSTYRVQLHAGFTFADAAALADYLDRLGAGALYTSPYLRAEPGSTHGYNVVDHAELNPELGGADGHAALVRALQEHGLGHVLDFVPNHVGVGAGGNRWWSDVLENGPASRFADYFDIDWHPPSIGLDHKVLLPVLGGQYGQELEDGKLSIVRDGGRFLVAYHERRWPAAPRALRTIFEGALARLELAADDPHRWELESILTGLHHLPDAAEVAPARRDERARENEVLKRRLGALCAASPEVAAALDEELASINPGPGSAGDPDRLDALLRDQNYRLAYWRVATEEINYRRFFDVNELAAIRMEDPRVFDATHALVLDLVARGAVTGLRLDHTDGLYDPAAYFAALQARARDAIRAAGGGPERALYVVAEKILEPGERLPRGWRIDGTSGYDFIAAVNGLWIDRGAEAAMTRFYSEHTGETPDVAGMIFDTKLVIMETSLSAEVVMLGQALRRLAEADRRSRDFTLQTLTRAVRATIAAFPVYRTYLTPAGTREPNDERHVDHAIALAKRKQRNVDPSVFDYLRDVLLLRVRTPDAIHFAMRFQQLSGPVMAKGVEDTAMYRYGRLVSLDEVGCDPARFGETIDSFHEHNARALAAFPLTMTTTTTHDTKRSEDVRARLAVLTELPDRWIAHVRRWTELAAPHLTRTRTGVAPAPGDQYLFWQTVVGAWPFAGEDPTLTPRLVAYMEKATREAKLHTSWTSPDAAYEAATRRFVERMLADRAFVDDVAALVAALAPHGACNSLAQLALKLGSPGVPDVYQGTELWDLSLVDPDNRRPVDYARRRAILDELDARGAAGARGGGEPTAALAGELLAAYADGRIKLHVTRRALQLRRRERLLFLEGGYQPIDGGEHVIAFERAHDGRRLVCVVPRLPVTLTRGGEAGRFPLGDVWGEQRLPVAGTFRDVFTGAELGGDSLALRDVLATLPIAWLLA
ncbi:MAG TPA: glycogen debranching protein GlgX [Kofleriaceae bacterium]|nr:glycogen debranching protein GlgX [Kofleriaceae bacterium]